jgi:hypothetical protein
MDETFEVERLKQVLTLVAGILEKQRKQREQLGEAVASLLRAGVKGLVEQLWRSPASSSPQCWLCGYPISGGTYTFHVNDIVFHERCTP